MAMFLSLSKPARFAIERQAFIGNLQLERAKAGLEVANEKLRLLDKAKSDFFANVSHELRTPLTLSIGPLEALLGEENRSVKKEQLEMIRRNQLRLLRLINDLLDFAKLEAGKSTLDIKRVQLQEMLGLLVSTVKGAAELRDITLNVDMPEEPVYLYIDHDKFEKVFMNLISNAFKFTDVGGTIKVAVVRRDDEVLIAVSDTGIGIPQDKLEMIFDRFSQVDTSTTRKYTGTGIGLAMVKEYTELHGGHIEVASELGKGSTFTLHYKLGRAHLNEAIVQAVEESEVDDDKPLKTGLTDLIRAELDGEEDENSERIPLEALADLAESSNPPPELSDDVMTHLANIEQRMLDDAKVLVVDDTPDMRRYIRGLLLPHYQVFTATNGAEALEVARVVMPDLIISDVMMPNMSGDELCQHIRKEPGRLSRTAIMLVTARADPKGKLEGLEVGADDYLYKPFVPAELLLRSRNLIRQRRQDRALMLAHNELSQKQREIDEDLAMARDFQQALLSSSSKGLPGLKLATVYRPASAVGGDFYDIHTFGTDHVRVFIADATDHGVQAALRTMMIKSEYDRLKSSIDSPATLLTQLNKVMLDRYPNEKNKYLGSNVTFAAICADIQLEAGAMQVTLAGGGHEQPIKVSNKRVEEMFVAGLTIGRMRGAAYGEKRFKLESHERVYLYSDGLIEQTNAQQKMFTHERLQAVLQAAHEEADVQDAVKHIVRSWEHFKGEVPASDDMTIIALEL